MTATKTRATRSERSPMGGRVCMLCGRVLPPSRVLVSREGKVVGAVCGDHPLRQVVLDPGDGRRRFFLTIELVEDPLKGAPPFGCAQRVEAVLRLRHDWRSGDRS